ncbi:DUF3598 domain-containing protein [Sandarakinorhabdus sp. DWP1-3-1]|uniref:DUF3598 domain-containing protein n=1 Tax=Sandarakinorhabdus sp. DWP1-3-1 TaxID=2804627 RepID=UPI003CF1A1FC
MGILDDMPLLARHEGVWDGSYTYFNAAGVEVDRHTSRLFCRFSDDPVHPYHQTNYYTWPDGRVDVRDFPATYRDKRIWWDNDLIIGSAWEVPQDHEGRTMMLYWQRTGDPSLYLYEMIQISDDGQNRCRTWHWIRNGQLETRTAIQETFVTRDWRSLDPALRKV